MNSANVPKVNIFGVPISKLGFRETIQVLADAVESRKPHQVITANPIMVMAALQDPGYMQLMKQAEFIVPDGAGVVWAAGYVGNPVAERVPGIEIMQEMVKLAEERSWKVFLLGASREVVEAAAAELKKQHPRLQLAGVRDGYFGADQDHQVIEEIRAANPDMLFVGRSADKQEPWIARYKEELGVPVVMGVGGSFDVLSGKLKRAPKLFRQLRMEWFYRLLQEPYRYKRMLILPRFAMKVIREKENVQKG
ncbi:MAG: N-acetylmannosaminyltransferase [Paenibacillaceae bacterium]|jgi:N-acetylglucosaminyldiphosphoundecaprenol N-acetyl-beta-D-mannosaminyltransferase|nr:N-acetylmannosaminyltransferase [Paenibacillaceae bacterium]